MKSLDNLNQYFVNKLLPNIVWMFVCLITGLVGNALVLFIYSLCINGKHRNARYFIPILACFDLLASTLSSLHGILHYFFFMNFPSEKLCKFLNFASFFTTTVSAYILMLVAIQRYRKICIPLGKQLNIFWKRTSLAIVIVCSIAFSVPICFTAGIKDLEKQNLTVSYCSCYSKNYPLFYKFHSSGYCLVILANIITVSILYTRITCQLYKHSSRQIPSSRGAIHQDKRKRKNQHQASEKNMETNNTNTCNSKPSKDGHLPTISFKRSKESTPVKITSDNQEPMDNAFSKANKDALCTNALPRSFQRSINNSKIKWTKTKVNFNKLFGVIVIFYLLSYVPTFTFLIAHSFGLLNDLDSNVAVFLNRLFIINHIVNPFVYGYFDIRFRQSLKSLLTCKP